MSIFPQMTCYYVFYCPSQNSTNTHCVHVYSNTCLRAIQVWEEQLKIKIHNNWLILTVLQSKINSVTFVFKWSLTFLFFLFLTLHWKCAKSFIFRFSKLTAYSKYKDKFQINGKVQFFTVKWSDLTCTIVWQIQVMQVSLMPVSLRNSLDQTARLRHSSLSWN